jgi:hypothetical protein
MKRARKKRVARTEGYRTLIKRLQQSESRLRRTKIKSTAVQNQKKENPEISSFLFPPPLDEYAEYQRDIDTTKRSAAAAAAVVVDDGGDDDDRHYREMRRQYVPSEDRLDEKTKNILTDIETFEERIQQRMVAPVRAVFRTRPDDEELKDNKTRYHHHSKARPTRPSRPHSAAPRQRVKGGAAKMHGRSQADETVGRRRPQSAAPRAPRAPDHRYHKPPPPPSVSRPVSSTNATLRTARDSNMAGGGDGGRTAVKEATGNYAAVVGAAPISSPRPSTARSSHTRTIQLELQKKRRTRPKSAAVVRQQRSHQQHQTNQTLKQNDEKLIKRLEKQHLSRPALQAVQREIYQVSSSPPCSAGAVRGSAGALAAAAQFVFQSRTKIKKKE